MHTPGPWEVNGGAIETVATPSFVIGRAYDEEDYGNDIDRSTGEANARLMAAAPDLLVACQRCLAMLNDSLEGQTNPDGEAFVAGITDMELSKDGGYMLSDLRAAITRALHGSEHGR